MRSFGFGRVRRRWPRGRQTARVLVLTAVLCGSWGATGRGGDAAAGGEAAAAADLLIRDARVYTLDPARPWAEAIAVRGDRIVHVGDLAAALPLVGEGTRVLSQPGGLVLPGFQDVHIHPYISGLDELDCSLFEADPVPEAYLERIAACREQMVDRSWISGAGWSPTAFSEEQPPSRVMLDAVVPDKPAVFFSSDGHTAWVNSRALAAADMDSDTPDPPNGRIDRDPASGEPSGTLQEAAMIVVRDLLPPPSAQQRRAAMTFMRDYLHSLGITAIQVAYASIDPADPLKALQTYRNFADSGELGLRTVISLRWDDSRGLEQIDDLVTARRRFSGGLIDAGTVKIFLDGVIEQQTAALLEDYSDRPGYRGELQMDEAMLRTAVARLDAEGFQVHMHVIGDRAVRAALDAFEHALAENGVTGGRHHLAHVQFVHPDDQRRFAALGVTATFSPVWAGGEDEFLSKLTLPRVGPERYTWNYPMRDLLDAGARIAFGSDWNVTTPDPLAAIESAVTRRHATHPSLPTFLPEQAISVGEAVAAATRTAAWVNHLDDRTGTLEVGKLADLVVLGANVLEGPPSAISEARPRYTVFNGEIVFEAELPAE
jgi:predicted amidohydrolase YtcJ